MHKDSKSIAKSTSLSLSAAVILGIGISAGNVRAAQLFRQELTLFGGGDVAVGSISFSYEDTPFEGVFDAQPSPGSEFFFPPLTIDASRDLREIVGGVSVNLFGSTTTLTSGGGAGSGTSSNVEAYFWTPFDSTAPSAIAGPNQVVSFASGAPGLDLFVESEWFFGFSRDSFFAVDDDSWVFAEVGDDLGFDPPLNLGTQGDPFASGRWELAGPPTAVPEPATVLGTIAAGTFGILLRRRKAT